MCYSWRDVMQVSHPPRAPSWLIARLLNSRPLACLVYFPSIPSQPTLRPDRGRPSSPQTPASCWLALHTLLAPRPLRSYWNHGTPEYRIPHLSQLTFSSVDEHRPSLHTGLDLSDDPWFSRSVRRRSQRLVPSPPSLAVSVPSLPLQSAPHPSR